MILRRFGIHIKGLTVQTLSGQPNYITCQRENLLPAYFYVNQVLKNTERRKNLPDAPSSPPQSDKINQRLCPSMTAIRPVFCHSSQKSIISPHFQAFGKKKPLQSAVLVV